MFETESFSDDKLSELQLVENKAKKLKNIAVNTVVFFILEF